jgi:CRISPR-associated endoribonuclease Cas6/Csy4 subtype I-F
MQYQTIFMLSCEIAEAVILSKLYKLIHTICVENKESDSFCSIGLSFPKYSTDKDNKTLGNQVVLFSTQDDLLKKIDIQGRINSKNLGDYFHVADIVDKPSAEIKLFHRARYKGDASKRRLIKRYAKRNDVSIDEASNYYESKKLASTDTKAPYARVFSTSTCEEFPIYIEPVDKELTGDTRFTMYALAN